MKATHFNLQFITHQTAAYDTIAGAHEALKGGCRWIQLRMKGATEEEVVVTGLELRELCIEGRPTFSLSAVK